ncbi:MAG: NAD(P)H-hydrate dehydratase [Saprospiraceae bacterium]
MLAILSPSQIKQVEELTCQELNITLYELMEQAGTAFTNWFLQSHPNFTSSVHIFCGNGNNGGDGLVIARLLQQADLNVCVYECNLSANSSADFLKNKILFHKLSLSEIIEIKDSTRDFPNIQVGDIIIDAILGTGSSRPLDSKWNPFIDYINSIKNFKISIDLPSGISADKIMEGNSIHADLVFGFEFPKLNYFLPEYSGSIKKWMIRSIGLSKNAINETPTPFYMIELKDIQSILKPRNKFAYKNNFGHLAIVAGNKNMNGAAILTSKASLRSGCGLVSSFVEEASMKELFVNISESIVYARSEFTSQKLVSFSAILIGPGMKDVKDLEEILEYAFDSNKPLILDAEAVNVLSQNSSLLGKIPKNTILTPHIGEFDRLLHLSHVNSIQRIEAAVQFAKKYQVIIIIKGAHTSIINMDGQVTFNTTGNQGMATAGCGDVLAGIIASLVAQGYSSLEATISGVFIHGFAADLALSKQSYESLIASDIIEYLGDTFKQIMPPVLL